MVGITRTTKDSEVLAGMENLQTNSDMLKAAITDHKFLVDRSTDQRLPEAMRSIFRKEAEKWDTEIIPTLTKVFDELPVPQRAKELMFSGADHISRTRAELAESDLRIEMLEKAAKDPRLRTSGELAIVSRLETALREKGESENTAAKRLRRAGGDALIMALVRYTTINAKEEMKTMAAVRRDLGIQEPTASILRDVEEAFVTLWENVGKGASKDPQFPKEFHALMQRSADEAKEYHRVSTRKPDETMMIDLGNPTTPSEMIAGQKEAVQRLEEEALDPQTKKERRELIMMWISGLNNTIFEQESQLASIDEALKEALTGAQPKDPPDILRKKGGGTNGPK